MAYLGSTQLSSVANPPIKVFEAEGPSPDGRITDGSTSLYTLNNYGFGLTTGTATPGRGFGQQVWLYHTTDTSCGIVADDYFTDAGELGMRPGDIVFNVIQSGTLGTSQYLRIQLVTGISSASNAGMSTAGIITCSTG